MERETTLNPDWNRMFQRGIEWCAPVGTEPASNLLLCTKDAHVDLIDLKTGRSRLAAAIPVQPGTRFAGGLGKIAFAHGVSRVYAFKVEFSEETKGALPGLLWQVVAAPRESTAGDPEFMTRIVAARATPSGVFIVRSDGRLAELAREDGSTRRRYDLPGIVSCELHVHGSDAALHWKQGDAFNVAFFDLTAETQDPAIRVVSEPLPIWTKLVDRGLVVVWRKRIGVVSSSGGLHFHELHGPAGAPAEARAANVDVHSTRRNPSEGRTGNGERSETLLIVSDALGGLSAYDPATGELRWFDNSVLLLPPRGEGCRWLRVSGDRILQVGTNWFAVREVDGDRSFNSRDYPRACVAAETRARFAYGLFADLSSGSGRSEQASLRLVRGVIGSLGNRRQNELSADSRTFELGEAGTIRDTFWLGGTLVVVEDRRLRAYTLP